MKIVIVGSGAFGQAIEYILKKKNAEVFFAERGKEFEADVVVLCVPVQSIRDVLPLIKFPSETKIIVNTAKGIEETTHLFPFQIVDEFFKDAVEYYSLMGPSFSSELLKDMPTLVNIGYKTDAKSKELVKELFQTDTFRIKLSEGFEILEIASAMKNVYAIGCGIADGIGYGENTRVTLLTLAIDEMQQYFCSLTYKLCMDATGAMIGDLILTCSSPESRNYQFGKYLVTHTTQEALSQVNSTVEGVKTINSLEYFLSQTQIELPFASFIARIVKENISDVRKEFDEFLKKV